METVISKEEFDNLMKIEGEMRGVGLKAYGEFVLIEEGEKGLKELEDTIAKLGYPIKFREITMANFHPFGIEAVTLLAIKRLFNYDDKKFQKMGRLQLKIPLVVRIFMKFFSIEKGMKEAQKAWGMQNTIGNLKVIDYNERDRYIIIRLENFRIHPLHCQVLIGIFSEALRLINSKGVCQETKCIHKGDEYHEFILRW